MATLVNVFVLMGTAVLAEGITTHSVTGCSDSVLLNCSITEMIHVERITYYNGTDCNQAVTDLQACGQPVTGSDTGLTPSCNGKVSSEEILHYCPGSKAAKVDYRCIPGSNVKDMCDGFIIENTNTIFLSTPNYPSSPNFTDISPCRCSIRGSSITSIQILELRLHTSGDGTKSSLEINYGDVTYKTESFSDTTRRRVYNKRLSTTSTTARITLNHNSINKTFLWIEVQGVSIRVSCNNDNDEISDVTTSSSSPRLTTPASSPAISSLLPSKSSSPTLTIPTSSSFSSPTLPSPTTSSSLSSSKPPPSLSPTSSPPPSSSTISSSQIPISSTTPTSATSSQSVSEEPNIEPSSSTDSSSSSTTTYPPQTADIKSHSQDSTPVIAGSVVGAVILIAIVIIIFIFIYRKRSKNRSSTTKPDSVKMDKNPDEIPMDFPSRGQPDGCEIDEDITGANNSVDVNHPDQTASPSNTDLVYAVVNKPGRTSSVDMESKSTDPDGTVVDTGSHYVHVDDDFVKDSEGNLQQSKDSSKGKLNQTHKGKSKDSLKGNPQGSYEAEAKDSPKGDTVNTVSNKSDKSLDGERNSPVLYHTLEDIDPRYADINDLFKQDLRPSQSEDTPRADSSEVKNSLRSSRKDGVRSGGIDQDTDHYSSIDQDTDHYSSIDAIGPTDPPNVKSTVSDTDSKVSSDKTQGSSSTRTREDSSYDPVYSVVNKAKALPKTDDNIPERIVIENELYVPFDDKSSDRIVIENDLYVPLEETLLKSV